MVWWLKRSSCLIHRTKIWQNYLLSQPHGYCHSGYIDHLGAQSFTSLKADLHLKVSYWNTSLMDPMSYWINSLSNLLKEETLFLHHRSKWLRPWSGGVNSTLSPVNSISKFLVSVSFETRGVNGGVINRFEKFMIFDSIKIQSPFWIFIYIFLKREVWNTQII